MVKALWDKSYGRIQNIPLRTLCVAVDIFLTFIVVGSIVSAIAIFLK